MKRRAGELSSPEETTEVVVGSLDGGDSGLPPPTAAYGSESMSPHFRLLPTLPIEHSDVVTFADPVRFERMTKHGGQAVDGKRSFKASPEHDRPLTAKRVDCTTAFIQLRYFIRSIFSRRK